MSFSVLMNLIPQNCAEKWWGGVLKQTISEITGLVLANFQYPRKERETHFQNSLDPLSIDFSLHSSNRHNSCLATDHTKDPGMQSRRSSATGIISRDL
jgi:hypothetical protein